MRAGRFVAAIGLLLVLAAPASGAIRITKIYYDPPGKDTGTNAHLNKEWVRIRNTGASKVALKGWTLRDTSGHVYTFPKASIGPGKVLYVHTGSGSNTVRHKYWGEDNYVWNNDGDKATLRRANGTKADSCRYAGGAPGYVTC
jgi:hypothetical protein